MTKKITKRPTDKQYIAVAKKLYQHDGELEFDDKPGTRLVSKARGNPEKGAYVQCWFFIYDDEVHAWKDKVMIEMPKARKK